jgi:hypothetical protein
MAQRDLARDPDDDRSVEPVDPATDIYGITLNRVLSRH